jgi:hypothetical protein
MQENCNGLYPTILLSSPLMVLQINTTAVVLVLSLLVMNMPVMIVMKRVSIYFLPFIMMRKLRTRGQTSLFHPLAIPIILPIILMISILLVLILHRIQHLQQ